MRRGLLVAWLVACGGDVPSTPVDPPCSAHLEGSAGPLPASALPELLPAPRGVLRPSPYAAPLSTEALAAAGVLEAHVRAHVLRADNAWSTAHALLALGPDAAFPDGASAIDATFARFAVRDGARVTFPRSRDGQPVEPHTGLVLKTLVELGVGPERTVPVGDGRVPLADVWRGNLAAAWIDGDRTSFTSPRDTPWTLHALAAWAPPGAAWTPAGHPEQTLDALTEAVVGTLVADTAFLAAARASGASFQKRGQGIFAHPCGGAHLLQGAAVAVGFGFGAQATRAAVVEQARLHLWRFPRELAILDAAVARAPADLRLVLEVQRLKFAGHHLETLHQLAVQGLLPADDAEVRASLEAGLAEVVRAVGTLAGGHRAFERLDEIRAARAQTWLDLLGDSAHALHGLRVHAGEAKLLALDPASSPTR
jgi:hypothetical protein